MKVSEAIAKSQYIFDQDKSIQIIGYLIGGVLITISFYNFYKFSNYKEGDKLSKSERSTIGLVLLFCAPWLPYSTYNSIEKNNRIIKNAVITTGMTQSWSSGKNRVVNYCFFINDQIYSSSVNPTYGGETMGNIRVPNGKYLVIYNRLNPEESIINFKVSESDMEECIFPNYSTPTITKPKQLVKQKPIDLKIHP